jgi:hypothetical protein
MDKVQVQYMHVVTTALNFQHINTKNAPQETTIKTNTLYPANAMIPLNIYHQNIRGLREKTNELLSQLHLAFPHIFILQNYELLRTTTNLYTLLQSGCLL